ncbi:DUF1381 domain-containing protein [Staphylococcus aureus]|nr:DUF1381 domain-containing protein [Staphylococcus aureus]
MLATIFMISTFAYKHQKTHILIAFLVMFFMSKLKQVQGSVEAESKEEAERKYEAQVKIRRDGDAKENGND